MTLIVFCNYTTLFWLVFTIPALKKELLIFNFEVLLFMNTSSLFVTSQFGGFVFHMQLINAKVNNVSFLQNADTYYVI